MATLQEEEVLIRKLYRERRNSSLERERERERQRGKILQRECEGGETEEAKGFDCEVGKGEDGVAVQQ